MKAGPFARLRLRQATRLVHEGAPGAAMAPQRFEVRDVVRLRTGGRPLARVGEVLPDGQLQVWVLKTSSGPQRWVGPKRVRASDVANNYGPLDDVGIGAKIRDQL